MNREIKFRAWEKELKEMIPIFSIDFEAKMVNRDRAWRMLSEIELMQSTGLKDKNGKEIYEGDVVETYWKTEVVKFWEFENCEDDYGFYAVCGCIISQYDKEETEVIWNVFENPELLK